MTSPAASTSTTTKAPITTTTTNIRASRPFTNPSTTRSISPKPQPHQLKYPPQALHAAQPLPIRTSNSHLPKSLQDPSFGILYPVASCGRGFMARPIRPLTTDQTVTVANPGGYAPRPVVAFPHAVRPIPTSHVDYPAHPVHMMRAPNLQQRPLLDSSGSGLTRGVSVSAQTKVVPPSTVSDSNGYKELRDRVRDDSYAVVRDRRVKITEGASLYALCRSWLRNGFPEQSQPQYGSRLSLPKPLPMSPSSNELLENKEDLEEEDEEDDESIKRLSPRDLLKVHVKHAKEIRARLRKRRLRRIARYGNRLALLFPSSV